MLPLVADHDELPAIAGTRSSNMAYIRVLHGLTERDAYDHSLYICDNTRVRCAFVNGRRDRSTAAQVQS
jgi:hypothetical protein